MANEGRTNNKSLLRSRGMQVLIVVVVVATFAVIYFASRTKAPTYFTSPAKTGNITSVVQATGVVNPIHTIAIGAQISGLITNIKADFNDKVKKGQLLAQIDPTVYQNALNSAEADLANSHATLSSAQAQVGVATANVSTAKANVAKAEAALNVATLQKDRSVGLFNQGIVSAAQRDTDVATFQTAQADLASAQAGEAQAEASMKSAQAQVQQANAVIKEKESSVRTAQTNLNYCNIYAPYDGVIVNRAVDLGQTVAASFSTPNMFTEATDLGTMWVYTQTDESDVGRLKDGDDATFTVDAFPNTVYHGIVKERRMNATTVQNVVEYDTIIEFQNTDQKIFPGMTAYVNIPVASARNVLEVPNSALRFKPDLTPVQLRQVLADNGMSDTTGGAGGTASGAASGAGGGGRAGGGGGQRAGGGGGRRGGGGGASASGDSNRPTTALIWKLDANKKLIPVRVRTGITDYTYTAITRVLQGSLQPGDDVITGALVVKSAASGLPGSTGGPRGGR
ncbi:MAG TPA: efflux RND transporter periplasmic adaptor subunit [Terriglobales bacterium]|nr:efflux RND transporter periplasmic adaptor subunit [Terriglobales bacterium]